MQLNNSISYFSSKNMRLVATNKRAQKMQVDRKDLKIPDTLSEDRGSLKDELCTAHLTWAGASRLANDKLEKSLALPFSPRKHQTFQGCPPKKQKQKCTGQVTVQ